MNQKKKISWLHLHRALPNQPIGVQNHSGLNGKSQRLNCPAKVKDCGMWNRVDLSLYPCPYPFISLGLSLPVVFFIISIMYPLESQQDNSVKGEYAITFGSFIPLLFTSETYTLQSVKCTGSPSCSLRYLATCTVCPCPPPPVGPLS